MCTTASQENQPSGLLILSFLLASACAESPVQWLTQLPAQFLLNLGYSKDENVCWGIDVLAPAPCLVLPLTGTLTQNEMVFKRLHLGTVAYGLDSMDEVQSHIFSIYTQVE